MKHQNPEAQYVSLYLLQKLSTSPYIYSKAQYIYSTPDLYQDWSQWTTNIAWKSLPDTVHKSKGYYAILWIYFNCHAIYCP